MRHSDANSDDQENAASDEAVTDNSDVTAVQRAFGEPFPLDQITDDHGPYQSLLRVRLPDGTVLSGDAAHDYLHRFARRHDSKGTPEDDVEPVLE